MGAYYWLPILLIVVLHIIFYHPKSKLAKNEHYNIRSYLQNISTTMILTLIPIVNIVVVFITVYSILEHLGITMGIEEWYEEQEEKVENWLNKKL